MSTFIIQHSRNDCSVAVLGQVHLRVREAGDDVWQDVVQCVGFTTQLSEEQLSLTCTHRGLTQ